MTLALLAIAAHPDDAELGCGGLLAKSAAAGHAVGIVDLTRGEAATNGTPEGRADEAAAAAAVLGLHVRENLGLPDAGLRADDPEHADALVAAIRRHRPALLVAPWIADRHPDHAAAGHLARRAWFLAGLAKHRPELGEPWRPRRLLHYPVRQELRPDLVVDVSAVYATKAAAIACHASQVGGSGAATLVNQPLGVDAFAVRDRYWGATIGVTHGEPYALGGPVPVDDPIALFAGHEPALFPPE